MKRLHAFILAQDAAENTPASVCGPGTPEPEASAIISLAGGDEFNDIASQTTVPPLAMSNSTACAVSNAGIAPAAAPMPQCSTTPIERSRSPSPSQPSDTQALLRKCIKALDTILLSLFMILGVIAAWRCSR